MFTDNMKKLFDKQYVNLSGRPLIRQVYRFSVVGIVNSAISYFIYVVLIFFGIQYQIANIVSYLFGLISSYFLNKKWTFINSDKHKTKVVILFVLLNLVSLSVSLLTLTLLVNLTVFSKYLLQIIAMAASTIVNFIGSKYLVFRK